MSNYVKAVDYQSKDALASGDPLKLIKGTELDDEFDAIAAMSATKQDNLPLADTTALVKGSGDATKQVRIEADNITAGTTRVITMPDRDITLLGTQMQEIFATASGTDTYTASLGTAITSYVANTFYHIKFTNANTITTPSINLHSLGAVTIKKFGSAALAVGDIPAGHIGILFYNGTDMLLCNPGLGGMAAATQAQMEAGTSNTVAVTPLSMNWHPGVAKAWASITNSGGAVTTNGSWQISSITRSSAGIFVFNFTTSFSSTAYICSGMWQSTSGATNNLCITINTLAVGAATINFGTAPGAATDPAYFATLVFFGDQ